VAINNGSSTCVLAFTRTDQGKAHAKCTGPEVTEFALENWLEMSEVESVEVDYVETVEEMGEG
jgi:hypothetical protein